MNTLPSGKAINRAGETLAHSDIHDEKSLEVLNAWRLYHVEDLTHEIKKLANVVSNYDGIILTGRIKRMDSIINKLRRKNKQFHLHQLNDIAGIRIITKDMEQSSRISQEISALYENSDVEDFRELPHNFGYRAIHHKVKIDKKPRDVRIEIQIRTRREQVWAGIVEVNDQIQETSYKSTGCMLDDEREMFELISQVLYKQDIGEDIEQDVLQRLQKNAKLKELHKKLLALRGSTFIAFKDLSGYSLLVLERDIQDLHVVPILEQEIEVAFKQYNNYQPSQRNNNRDAVLMVSNSIDDATTAFAQITLDTNYILKYLKFLYKI